MNRFLLALLPFACPLIPAQGDWDLARLHPPETAVHLTVSGIPCRQFGRELALSKILRDPDVQAFLAPLREMLGAQMGQASEEMHQATGFTLPEMLGILSRARLSLGFSGLGEGMPLFQFAAEIQGEPETAAKLAKALATLAGVQGMNAEPVKFGTVGGWRLSSDSEWGGAPDLWIGFQGPVILAATTENEIAAMAGRLEGKSDGPTLENQGSYRRLAARTQSRTSMASLQMNVQRLIEMFEGMMDDEALHFLDAFNIRCIEGFAYSVEMDGPGIRERAYLHIPAPEGFIKTLSRVRTASIRSDAVLPAETALYAAFQAPLAELVPSVIKAVSAMDPREGRAIERALGRMKEATGLDLVDDVLAHLDHEVAIFGSLPTQSLIPDVGIMLAVKDQARLDAAIRKLISTAHPELGVRSLPFQDHMIHSLDIEPLLEGRMGGGMGIGVQTMLARGISWTYVDGFLVAGLWPQAAKNLIAGLNARKPRLKDNGDYQRLQERLRFGNPLAGNTGREYLDIKRAAGFALDNGVPLAQMLLPTKLWIPGFSIDWALLPTTETVTRHLFGMASASTWDDTGVTTESYSPMGQISGAMFLGAAASLMWARASAAPVPWVQIEDTPEMRIARAHMDVQMLAAAAEAFRTVEGRLPSREEWPFTLLSGSPNHPMPYAECSPFDPWGRPYILRTLPDGSIAVESHGADGVPGGDGENGDISSKR